MAWYWTRVLHGGRSVANRQSHGTTLQVDIRLDLYEGHTVKYLGKETMYLTNESRK